MSKVTIGKTDLKVFPIGLGTNAVGGHNLYPNLNEETGKELVREAIKSGVTMLDTAYIYGVGRSEELIGEVLKEYNREDVFIATKAAHRKEGDDFVFDNSPAFLKQSVEDSLKRLQTDYIDLFYIHFPDEHTHETIFGFLPRVALGSLLAFIFSQTIDVYVYSAIRRIFPSDRLLWLRNSGSTALSQLLDTFIFTAVAFIGVYSAGVWFSIFISTYLIKFAVSLISVPYAYAAKRMTPKGE